jgi:hypothetical protein
MDAGVIACDANGAITLLSRPHASFTACRSMEVRRVTSAWPTTFI